MIHNNDAGIPCPVCSTKIPFDVHQLLKGVQFACPTCNAVIGLGSESRSMVQEAMTKLEEAKTNISNRKNQPQIPGLLSK